MGLLVRRLASPEARVALPGKGSGNAAVRWASRIVALALLSAWMVFLFFLSSLTPAELPEQNDFFAWLGPVKDYAAHFGLYGILGVLLLASLAAWRWPGTAWQWVAAGALSGLLYGVSDEFHQSFTPGRSVSGWDVLADTAGAATGVAFGMLAQRLRRRRVSMALLIAASVLLVLGPPLAANEAYAQQIPVQPEVQSLTVGSRVANPGEPVEVVAEVRNPAGESASLTLVLFMDEAPIDARVITLPAGAVQLVRFHVVQAIPGAHVVRLGPQAVTYVVVSPQFQLQDLVVRPQVVSPGDPISITATVKNTGSVPVVFHAPLSVNSVLADARSDLLLVGEESAIAFRLVKSEAGAYTVQVGDLRGAFLVAGKDLDIAAPASIPLSAGSAKALDAGGAPLPLTGAALTLAYAGGVLTATLPVRVDSGRDLASFADEVSGVTYDGAHLVLPWRDDLNRIAARLVLRPQAVLSFGDSVHLAGGQVAFELAETLLRLPLSFTPAAPVTFSMAAPVQAMTPGGPLRITPALQPPIATWAAMELAAQARGKTIGGFVATAALQTTALSLGGDAPPSVTFGVPSAWLASVQPGSLSIISAGRDGTVEILEPSASPVRFGRVELTANLTRIGATVSLVTLSDAVVVKVTSLVVPSGPVSSASSLLVEARVEAPSDIILPLAPVVLRLNGQPVGLGQVVRSAQGALSAKFALAAGNEGAYNFSVDTVQAKAQVGILDVRGLVQVTQLGVSPAAAALGEPVTVNAALTNVDTKPLLAEVSLQVNGEVVEKQSLSLGGGGSANVVFSLTRAKEGNYEVVLLGRHTRFVVGAGPTPAQISASNLVLDNTSLNLGEKVGVQFLLSNAGELPGTHVARIFLNGEEAARQEFSLGPEMRLPVAMEIQPPGEGIYSLELEGLRRQFVVVSPLQRADLVVDRLEVSPFTVQGGEPVTVMVVIHNRFTETATSTLRLLVNEKEVSSTALVVLGAQAVQRQFTITEALPGFYEVDLRLSRNEGSVISIYKGQFLVTRSQSLADWEISLLEILPRLARPGEPLQVSLLLSNVGQQSGLGVLVAKIDGQEAWSDTITLAGQTTRNFSFTLPAQSSGEHVLDVNGNQVPFTVAAHQTLVPAPSPTPTEAVAAPSGNANALAAGIAVIAVLGLAVAGFWFLLRKRK